MELEKAPKGHRYPASIMGMAVWLYHRFNLSYRDVQEQMGYRGIIMSHESIRYWCIKFADHYKNIIRKRERKLTDKWHLDEM